MNIISFDTEEWYIEKTRLGDNKTRYKVYDDYLDRILDMLDFGGLKATFFCVGGLAKYYPEVVQRIANRGHEIGCHSNTHVWLTNFDRKQLYDDTHVAIATIEDVIGKKVLSYRAPAFSIGEKNKWALEVLAECGIERDSSVYPSVRDFGGFSSFQSKSPCLVKTGEYTIKEFPISLTQSLGRDFAYSGGGYFRLLPLWYVKNVMRKEDYNMCYFHISDLEYHKMQMEEKKVFEEYYKIPPTLKNRTIRMIKSCIGTKGAFDKMVKLVSTFDYLSLEDADNIIDWNKAQTIEL